jgi:hypothetical protein
MTSSLRRSKKNTLARGSVQSLGTITGKLLNPLMEKQGFHVSRLIFNWRFLVPPEWSQCTMPYKVWIPEKTGYGILYLDVWDRSILEAQWSSPVFIQGANKYFGYKALHTVKFRQQYTTLQNPKGPTSPSQEKIHPSQDTDLSNLHETLDSPAHASSITARNSHKSTMDLFAQDIASAKNAQHSFDLHKNSYSSNNFIPSSSPSSSKKIQDFSLIQDLSRTLGDLPIDQALKRLLEAFCQDKT